MTTAAGSPYSESTSRMLKSRESFIKKQLRVEDQLSRALGSAFCPGTPGRIARGSDLPHLTRVARAVPRVHGGALSRRKIVLMASLVAGSSQRPDWARCTPGGLTGVIPHGVLPPRVLVRVCFSAVPLVRVCAAGVGSVWGVCGAGAPRAAPWPLFCLKTCCFFNRFCSVSTGFLLAVCLPAPTSNRGEPEWQARARCAGTWCKLRFATCVAGTSTGCGEPRIGAEATRAGVGRRRL